ncbi:acyl--CoA ligase [Acidiferrimicrobium sp. IK]|uniref:class I adenylate-forming enzyme family protein n=1 Tax=Acidiferrimicrobium sp. IK TaxID=2871700 RepID=UPI0021CB8DC9|nr:class I adenylate-forming enzyme family protein [Acidiferrimicrobium sp. IK]MCU4184615.1 acyl--CoA ligase [Acidiferrimicrobium sp. IK]
MSTSQTQTAASGAGDVFEIVEVGIGGARMPVFKHTPASLRDLWELSAGHGDAAYLVYDDERLSYKEAHAQVASLASWLRDECRVRKGDRVAIGMRNFPEWAISFWATAALGAVAVPLNAWWSGPELDYALRDSASVVLIADGERLERLGPYQRDLDLRSVVAVRSTAPPGGAVPFDELVAADVGGLPAADIQPDDTALIMYTSGTTGRPKGAVATHRNICAQVMNIMWMAAAAADPTAAPATSAPCTLLTFPLFHVGGLHSFLIPYTAIGGKVVLLYKWDAPSALRLVAAEGVTAIAGVPTTMFQLLDEAKRQGVTLDSLAGVASGATLVPAQLVRRIDAELGSKAAPSNAYGLTETAGAAVINVGASCVSHPDSVGRPISPVMAVSIRDPGGAEVTTGEVGEIWLRGPTVFSGYWRNPEATSEALVEGWFRTGDLGRVDPDGFLYVVDRIKDVVIRGGENVYAAEVEAALYEHPAVAEVAVVGVPDDVLGEVVAAVVRLRDGAAASDAELRDHVRARLAAFKVPAIVELSDGELPRNAAGKVLKGQLRRGLADRHGGHPGDA